MGNFEYLVQFKQQFLYTTNNLWFRAVKKVVATGTPVDLGI